jgi:hypothetical protein
MTHEKLVTGTESPTRYTKIIRNPGAGTKYNRTYQEAGYVSRYTKTVAGGKDSVPPAPPEPEYDELVIAENGGANFVGSNVYEIGQVVTGKTAVFTGGNPDKTAYRSRWQTRDDAQDSWINSNWMNTTNEKNDHEYPILKPGQLRFQSQGRDTSVDPVKQVNSFTSVKDVPFLEFGTFTVTINDIEYDHDTAPPLTILMNDPMPVVVTHTGNASPSYAYSARGNYPLMVGSQTASTVLTFPQEGTATVTCTLADSNTEEVTTSVIMNFYVVNAKEFEELKSNGEI